MVLKLPSRCRKRNHLARRRIDLVCSVVESLLRHYGTASIVDGSVFSFDAAAEAEAAEAEKTSSSSPSSENRSPPPPPPPPSDLQQLNRGDSGVNSNNNTNDSSRTTTIGTHCTENGRTEGLLVDLFCEHLFAALKNHYHHHHHQSNLLIIIIVVAEGELARLQTALEGWKTKELESEGVKWRRVRIRLIKVAGVGGDTEEKLPQNKSTEEKEEEEEDENEQTIEATAQALHLLSRPLHSPITRASIPDTTRAEAAFLQYNIARINSILDKYSSSSNIKSGGDYISDDQSTTTTTISPDCTKVVPEAAAASASANLKSLTADDDEWHLVLLYWLPLAQLADELYSQLLLMETETTMTGDSADINDQQEEENHAKTVMVTSAAEAVAVDVCSPVLDVHKVSRLLARLAHGFSVYYRKVKILRLQLPPSAEESREEEASETNAATATDAKTKTAAATDHHYHHLLQLMAARVRLCALIRQQLLFYLCSLLGIAAVQKM